MKAIGIFAIDSWHLANSIHFPEVKTSSITDFELAVDWLANIAVDYGLRDENGDKITRACIVEECGKNGARIFFSSPREGYLILRLEK